MEEENHQHHHLFPHHKDNENSLSEEYQTTYTDTEKCENKRADEVQNTYGTEKSKNKPVDEFQTTYTDIEKHENKSNEEFQTSYSDTQKYDNKPGNEFQTTFTDNEEYESKLGGEFQTTYNDIENDNNNPIDAPKKTFAEGTSTISGYGEATANTSFALSNEVKKDFEGKKKHCNLFQEDKNYQPIDETRNTFITGEDDENKLISGYGDNTTDSKTFAIATDAKNDYEVEDENIQDTIPNSDGYKESFSDGVSDMVTEAKHDYEEEGSYALRDNKQSENDPEEVHKHKIEEVNATTDTVGAGEFEYHENKEAKEEDDETHGKKRNFYKF